MKLFESIKNDTKKRSIFIGILASVILVSVLTVCIAVSIAQQKDEPPTPQGTDTEDNLPVFLPQDGTETESPHDTDSTSDETAEPIDLTGINGLEYVSLGNGTCYINGLGSCTETSLKLPSYSPAGDKVVRIGDTAFENCSSLLTVQIPETVNSVGMGAFRGCSSLTAITVDEGNEVYCSEGGALYSKDKSVLICVPMNRPESSILLCNSVTAVAAYAFEGVKNLRAILYEGSINSYSRIEFLEGNDIVNTLAITCNYSKDR